MSSVDITVTCVINSEGKSLRISTDAQASGKWKSISLTAPDDDIAGFLVELQNEIASALHKLGR